MTLAFWKAAAERAVKTFAQAVLALLGTGSVGITSLDWRMILSVSATAALASVLTSLASLSTVADTTKPTEVGAVLVDAPAAPAVSFAATQAKISALPEADYVPLDKPASDPAAPNTIA